MSDNISGRLSAEKHANMAYEAGFFVEAIQVLHAWVENQARSLFMLVGAVHFSANQADTWDLADTFSLSRCLDALYILNQITKEEYESFRLLNAMRNKVIHQIYREPYERQYHGIPRDEYDRVFNESMRQADFFTRKTEEIIERQI